MEKIDMDRQWICMKERKLLCTEFIYILDSYRCCAALQLRGNRICEQYNYMICVLQELTSDYLEGEDYIGEQLSDFFKRHYMEMPLTRKLPEALEELFEQLESKLRVDFTEMLDRCEIRSNEAYLRIQEAQVKEEQRISLVKSLMKENEINISKDETPANQIREVILLQQAKVKSELYEISEKEINITRLWCDMLVSSIFSEVISYGLMVRLVENEIMTEYEISELLENKYGIEKDYEWYSEDFLGCGMEEVTDIKIEDIMTLCSERVGNVIGVEMIL